MAAINPLGATKYLHKEPAFRVEYAYRRQPYNMDSDHAHDSYEIYYLFAGQRKYYIQDHVYLIAQGDLVFIPKQALHRTLDVGNPTHERIMLHFNETFLEECFGTDSVMKVLAPFGKEIPTVRLKPDDRQLIEGLLHKMTKELKERAEGHVIYLKALIIEFLLQLRRCLDRYDMSSKSTDAPLHRKIYEVANYIQDNYMEPLTLAHLSQRYFISTYYLSRMFKETFGISFIEYLNHVRIKKAQQLLQETEWKILRVSEHAGFENIAHFGRVFKQATGLSPSQYRRLQTNTQL
jgi:AraC-like DNA-binding protein